MEDKKCHKAALEKKMEEVRVVTLVVTIVIKVTLGVGWSEGRRYVLTKLQVKEKNKTRGGGEEGDEDIDSRSGLAKIIKL